MKNKFQPYGLYTDLRDAFFEELFQIAKKDKDVILLMADQGAMGIDKMKKEIPNQVINVGISEQNMISVAAGLSLSGKKVFAHAISTFTTLRCYEQIKVDLSIMNLPVTIAGIGAGYAYGSDGPTHHSNQDLSIMRAIPNIRILNATDTINLSIFPHLAYQKPHLTYIRFDKANTKNLYDYQKDNFEDGMKLIKKGKDVCIISTGVITHKALEIARILKEKNNFDIAVLDIYQLKPLNENLLKKIVKNYQYIVTLEEHISYGGLGSIISDFLTDNQIFKNFKRLGLPDKHLFVYGDRDFMHKAVNLDNGKIIKVITNLVSNNHAE